MMEGIRVDFFKVDEFHEGSLLKRSVENLEIFEGFSAYVVEGRSCSVDTAKQYGQTVRKVISDSTGYDCKYGESWSRLDSTHNGLLRKYPAQKRRRDPILIQDLRTLHGLLDLSVHTWTMYWALSMITFFGVSRKGDHIAETQSSFSKMHHTTVSDVEFKGDHMYIKMQEHKTSRVSKNFTCKPFVSAEADNPLCPVRAVRNYMLLAGIINEDNVVEVHENTGLFFHNGGERVVGRHFLQFVKQAMKHVGKNPDYYGTHSMRIGGATLAMSCTSGNHETVRMMGFWLSNVMETYVYPSKETMTKLSREMMSTTATNLADVCNSEGDERELTSPEGDV